MLEHQETFFSIPDVRHGTVSMETLPVVLTLSFYETQLCRSLSNKYGRMITSALCLHILLVINVVIIGFSSQSMLGKMGGATHFGHSCVNVDTSLVVADLLSLHVRPITDSVVNGRQSEAAWSNEFLVLVRRLAGRR